MKRVLVCALSAFLVAASVGLTGCDSGGIAEGPPDTSTPGVAPDKIKEMGNMLNGPKDPSKGGATPKPAAPDAAAPAPTPEKKN